MRRLSRFANTVPRCSRNDRICIPVSFPIQSHLKLSRLNNSGYALYLVLAVLSVIFIFDWNILRQSSIQHAAIARFNKQNMASLAAFSGIECAKANLAEDPEMSLHDTPHSGSYFFFAFFGISQPRQL